MSYLQDKETVKSLFGEVAGRIAERQGGYTRIIKLGETRLGDGSEMCLMELVDFNDIYTKDGAAKKALEDFAHATKEYDPRKDLLQKAKA